MVSLLLSVQQWLITTSEEDSVVKFKTKPKVKILTEINDDAGVAYFKLIKINKHKNTEIGQLEVDLRGEEEYFVNSVHIMTTYRNNGLGKRLYRTALKKFGQLKTHYFDASIDAQRVWRSMSKRYKSSTEFFEGVLTLYYKPK